MKKPVDTVLANYSDGSAHGIRFNNGHTHKYNDVMTVSLPQTA
jgi:hypothetical protein